MIPNTYAAERTALLIVEAFILSFFASAPAYAAPICSGKSELEAG